MNILKRRVLTLGVLQFLMILLYTIVTPFYPGEKDKIYPAYAFISVMIFLFGFFITKRKYRLPRIYILRVSLLFSAVSMILLSINNFDSVVAQIVIIILSNILFGLGFAAGISITIVLLLSSYSE